MSDRTPPHDIEAERAILGSALVWPSGIDELIGAGLRPRHFYAPQHGATWAAMLDMRSAVMDIDIVGLVQRAELDATAALGIQASAVSTTSAVRQSRTVIDHAVRRDLIVRASEAIEASYALADPGQVSGLLDAAAAYGIESLPVDTVPSPEYAKRSEPYDWVMPHVLERGDRLLITGTEGSGKSVLLIQLAVMAASGVHWWTWRPVPPVRVLYVDLELGERRIGRHLRWIGAPENLRISSRPEGIDLLGGDGAWLARQLAAHPADILAIGPVYKLSAGVAARGDMGAEDMTRRLVAVLDRLRTRFKCGLIMETHAPHAQYGSQRDLRPFGSSVWLRWPDFGIGLRRIDDPPGRHNVAHWRGPRDDRWWPTALDRNGKTWPWEPYFANGMPEEPA